MSASCWQPWFIAWSARPDDPVPWGYGWMLEEYRLSLFAPDIPTELEVSEKRLHARTPSRFVRNIKTAFGDKHVAASRNPPATL